MLDFLLNHTPLFYLTQSLWRDEAFSVLTAEKPILSFIGTLNFEPPFYYVLLHIWIKVFGESEVAVRSLSLFGFLLATCVVILWAEKLFKRHFLIWLLPLLFFLNPMLLYYAFEVRAYGWVMFFATLSLYAYSQKKHTLLAVANIFVFYTHSYGLLIPFVQTCHFLFEYILSHKGIQLKKIIQEKHIHSLVWTGIAIAPWFIPIYEEAKKMRPTWYYPVDMQLVRSVLGNMFIGYDGTPGGLWKYTALLSFILIFLFSLAFRAKEHKRERTFLLFMIFLPLILVIWISFFKPLFVNRYLIFVTISQVLILSLSLSAIRTKWIQKILAITMVLFCLGVNVYLPSRKAKLDIRTTVAQANAIAQEGDVLFVTDPLIFFETIYYTTDRQRVYLYNPDNNPFPWYVGETAFSPDQMARELPLFPQRAVFINPDQSITISYRTHEPKQPI